MTRRALLLSVVALSACGPTAPARPPGQATAAATMASVVPATPALAETKPSEEADWAYSSVGKRDPFRSFLSELSSQAGVLATRCSTPLGRYEVEQLKLVAVITGLEDPVAMVETPTGVGYSVRRGACLGKNGGSVAAVRSGEVIISEWAVRADGTRDSTQTVLRLPKPAGPNLEE